jgi:hypothetical protein
MAVRTRFKRHRHLEIFGFSATTDHGAGKRTCNTGSVLDPSDRKTSPDDATADTSAGRIGKKPDGAGRDATNAPICFGFSEVWKAERAAEPPRGPLLAGDESPETLSERDAAQAASA